MVFCFLKNEENVHACSSWFSLYDDMTMAAMIFIPVLVLCGTGWAYAAVNCRETGGGRFADPADDKCMNYTLCVYVRDTDSYVTYNAVCPSEFVFNPKTFKCTSPTKYTCSNRIIDTTEAKQSKICTYDGYIADPEHRSCSTYIQCVNISGEFTQLRQSCPGTTYFNPKTTLCEANYKCVKFTCSSAGRFADTTDLTCRKYYYCVHLYNETYAQFEYSCPADSMFHPKIKRCTTNFKCS